MNSDALEVPALGSPVQLQPRARLALDESARVYVVESGAVALASRDTPGRPALAQRRVLARLGPGKALVSVPNRRARRLRLEALGAQDAVLRSIPFAAWWHARHAPGSPVCRLVDEWVEILARLLEGESAPGAVQRVLRGQPQELAEGQLLCARPRSVLWLRVLAGSLCCMDDERLVLTPASAPFPVGAGLWLRAQEAAQVQACGAGELERADEVLEGLALLRELLLERLADRGERQARGEAQRLSAREREVDQQVDAALAGLAGVLDPRVEPLVGDDLLLKAMTAIGRSLGVAVRPPAASDEPRRDDDPVEAIARASHLRVRRVRLAGSWWQRDCGTLLVFGGESGRRPLALLPRGGGRYDLLDPGDGSRVPLRRELAVGLAPGARQVYRPLPAGALRAAQLLRFALVGRGRDLALALAAGVAATLLGMITPLAVQSLMDHAIPDADRGLLVELGLGLCLAAFGIALFGLSLGLVLQHIGLRMEADTQAALWDRLLRLRPSFFRRYSSGDLQARVTSVDEVGRALGGNVIVSVFAGALALMNLGLLYHFSPRLAGLALGVALLVLVVACGVGVSVQRRIARLVELEGSLYGFVVQLLEGIGKLRVAGAERRAYTRWLREYARQLGLWARIHVVSDRLAVFGELVPPGGLVLLLVLAHAQLVAGRSGEDGLSLGAFLAFNTAFATFLAAVTSLSRLGVDLVDQFTRAQRALPILAETPEVDQSKADPGRLTGRLALEALEFGYSPGGPRVIDRLDLEVEPGEFVALVGPSGSGKSTLFRLLLGFESPTSGSLRYDGQDLSTLDVLAVRRQIGVVLQGGVPDPVSIFENISSGNTLTLDEAWAAAEDAGLAEDIRQMPMGMHTLVSVGGANLSGGQRQRLLIARALAMHPRILLLDEATSALDNRTQEVVSSGLERLRITRLVIAHRLSTIRRADRIHVFEKGRIVQAGSFEELARAPGRFARMMLRQFA